MRRLVGLMRAVRLVCEQGRPRPQRAKPRRREGSAVKTQETRPSQRTQANPSRRRITHESPKRALTYQERRERGRAARREAPRSSHAAWTPAPDRPDPVDLLEAQAKGREPDLVPIRYARMIPIPLHVHARGGDSHGQRPLGHAADRHPGPAVRRLSPLELRGLRLTGANPAVRRQRLRRDAARAVGVGREAPRHEHGRGGQGQRFRRGRCREGRRTRPRPRTGSGWPSSRRWESSRSGTRA